MERRDRDPLEILESFRELREIYARTKKQARTYTHLKVMEFVGWVGRWAEVHLANYLIESAVSLEKIVFDLRLPHLFWWGYFLPVEGNRESAILSAKQLERKLPPGATSIIEE